MDQHEEQYKQGAHARYNIFKQTNWETDTQWMVAHHTCLPNRKQWWF